MNRRRVALAIGVSAVMVVVIAGLLPREYLANDDIGFTEYLRANTFTPWMSPPLVRAFCAAYQNAPGVPWFGLYQYTLIFATGAILIHTCLELVDTRVGLGRTLTLIGAIVFAVSQSILVVGITWTTVSISGIGTAVAAAVAHVHLCEANKQPLSRLRATIYGLVLVGAYMLRPQGLGATAVALAPLLAWTALHLWKRRYLPRLTTVALFVAPFALVFLIQNRIPHPPGHNRAEFQKWTDVRGAIHAHYAFEGLDKRAPEILERAGWTIEEYRDFSNWLIVDEDQYSVEKMQRLLDTGGAPEEVGVEWSYRQLRGIFNDSAASVSLFLTAMLAAGLLASLGIVRRGPTLWYCLSYVVFLVGVPLWMSAHLRFPQRVSLSFYSVAALGVFVYIARALAERPADAPAGPADHRHTLAFTTFALALVVWGTYLFAWLDRDIQTQRDERQVFEDRVTERHGWVFVYVQHGLVELDPLRARPRNYEGLQGGWGTFSPTWYDTLDKLGVHRGSEMLGAMLDNPNAYLLTQLAGRVPLEEWIQRKLGNPAARLSLVDAAEIPGGARPDLYRIVSTPLVRNSEEWKALERAEVESAMWLAGPPSVDALALHPAAAGTVSELRHPAVRVDLAPIVGGLRVTVAGGAAGDDCAVTGQDGHYAGVHIPITGLLAARFEIVLIDPDNIVGLDVFALTKTSRSVRWRWALNEDAQRFGYAGTVTVVPGYPARQLQLVANTARLRDIRDLHILIAVKPGTHAGFELRNIQVAEP